ETLYPKLSYGWSELRGIHTAHWMYVRAPKPELYDLHTDPGELNNVIDAHPKEYRELEQQLKSASRLGNKETETVVANQMDQKTTEQLRSLGYVGGSSSQDIQLNGKGADPKDRVDVLRALHVVTGQDAQKLSASQKIAKLRAVLAEDPTNLALYSDLADQYQAINQYPQALQTYLAAEQHGAANGMTYS